MKKILALLTVSALFSCGCVRFKTPTQELEIDATMLIPTEETTAK